ncbi:MAG: heparinase II/III domain-containing protein, partial [Armatimonadota bacterium]
MRFGLLLVLFGATILAAGAAFAKTGSHIITEEMRKNALRNIERYEWAADQQGAAVRAAEPYVEMSDEELWRMLPSQYVPRNCGVHDTAGCPNCGDEILNVKEPQMYMRYEYDRAANPWKLKCKNCGTLFPSNDFGAYYRSGLDDRGEFDPELADRSLLFNPEHPDPNDPDHTKWVDDGYGLESEGETLTIIAHYTYWLWRECTDAASKLSHAYNLTGDPIYAHKAGVLLDRFADLYPNIDYNGFVAANGWGISDGGSNQGMILGRIWETGTASDLSAAYDAVYEQMLGDDELMEFAARMRERYPGLEEKPDTEAIARHIEDNLITLFCEAVIDERIRGNIGMTERAMAMSAIALDRPERTERYLDWLFEDSYRTIPEVLVDLLSRDGPSYEAAPGYSLSPRGLVPVADLLQQYDGYTKHDLYRDYPKMKKIFLAPAAFRCLNEVTPTLGDSGKVGGYGDVRHPVDLMISGFRAYGTEDVARELWRSALYDDARLERSLDIFDDEPNAILEELLALKPELPMALESENRSGYGLAVLQSPSQENGRCVYTSYGRTTGSHPHNDRLHIGIFAKGFVMMPDLGYPEYTGSWPKRHAWTNHTVSHNTVMVNDRKQ